MLAKAVTMAKKLGQGRRAREMKSKEGKGKGQRWYKNKRGINWPWIGIPWK